MPAQGWDDPFRAAVLAALESPDASRQLAETLAPYLVDKLQPSGNADGWLDVRGAAAYLGMSPAQIHKLTSARVVPFSQDGPGCKCWFKRSDLDEWRYSGGARSGRAA